MNNPGTRRAAGPDPLEDSNRPDALADPNIIRELRAAGVGYAYFGSHADASRVPQLLASGRAQVIYRDGAVIILQLRL